MSKICEICGRKMKRQFVGLEHCTCGTSWKRDMGYFRRTPDMEFALQRKLVNGKVRQVPVIRSSAADK